MPSPRPAPTPPAPRARVLLAPSRLVELCPAPAQAAADATSGAPPSPAAARQVSQGHPALGRARGADAAAPANRRRRTCFGGLGLGPCPGLPGPLGVDAPRAHTASPSGYPPCAPLARGAPGPPARPPPLTGAPPAEVRSPFPKRTPTGSRAPPALTRAAAPQPSSDKLSARGLRLFSCSQPASGLVSTAAPKKDPRPTEPPSGPGAQTDPCLPASQKRPYPRPAHPQPRQLGPVTLLRAQGPGMGSPGCGSAVRQGRATAALPWNLRPLPVLFARAIFG